MYVLCKYVYVYMCVFCCAMCVSVCGHVCPHCPVHCNAYSIRSYYACILIGSMKTQVQARTAQQLGGLMETVVSTVVKIIVGILPKDNNETPRSLRKSIKF